MSISADLGNGPGIQEIATFSADVSGAHGNILVTDAHGTITGAAGGVLLTPLRDCFPTTATTASPPSERQRT